MHGMRGRKILITGATSGIGRALAELAARDGAALALCGRSEEKMTEVLQALEGETRPFHRTFCVSDETRIVDFVRDASRALGGIDVLVNCAGLNSARAAVADMKTEDLEWMLTVNVKAPLVFMREVFREMKARKGGHIINVLSTVCLFANEGIGAYTASKAALDGLTKVFRKEARADNVKVTAVYPGGVNTTFRAQARPEYLSPEEVASAIAGLITAPGAGAVHELVLRPMVESNFC